MKRTSNTFALVTMAVYAAIIVLAIQFLKVPMPSAISNSMVHPGNALVALSGLFLGYKRGLVASSLGLFIYDVMNGYGVVGAIDTVSQSVVIILIIEAVFKGIFKHQDTKPAIITVGIVAALAKIVIKYAIFFVKQLALGVTFSAAAATALTGMPATLFTALITAILVPVLYFPLKPVFKQFQHEALLQS